MLLLVGHLSSSDAAPGTCSSSARPLPAGLVWCGARGGVSCHRVLAHIPVACALAFAAKNRCFPRMVVVDVRMWI